MSRPILTPRGGFDAPIVEKVERLLELLDTIAHNPFLASRLVLHGGTALNVFHADLPRLSVDVDLAYVGSAALDEMRADRPLVDVEIRTMAVKLGYVVKSLHQEHSGQSYRLRYGSDYVKVDVNYLARVPLLEPEIASCTSCRPPVSFLTLQMPELIAGKVAALVDRAASRDLYDIYTLSRTAGVPTLDAGLARAVVLHAVSLTDRFPFERDPAAGLDKLTAPSEAHLQELRSVLGGADPPDFAEMRRGAASYMRPLAALTQDETDYMDLLGGSADHRPELLFARWPEMAERARSSPVVAWKVRNLRKLLVDRPQS